jgi:hypothetical protein
MKDVDAVGRRGDRGQVLVMFAGGLILLMAICALVIDLGFVFMKARHEQDAADPSAVAAARYIRVPSTGTSDIPSMWTAACAYAVGNGFHPTRTDNNQRCDTSTPDDQSRLTVNYPPSRGAGQYAGHLGFVEVVISQPHHALFAGILGLSNIQVTRSAVAAFSRGDSNSSSLIALHDGHDICPSATIGGNSSVTIHAIADATGGYVQVNSDCNAVPNPDNWCTGSGSGQTALKINGTGIVTAPHTYVVGSCNAPGGGTLSPSGSLTESANYLGDPLTALRPPDQNPEGAVCPVANQTDPNNGTRTVAGGPGCSFDHTNVYTLAPGTYYGGWRISNKPTVNLKPGIYIIAGGGISAGSGGTLDSVAGPSGNPDTARVLIFSTDISTSHAACVTGLSGTRTANECQQNIDVSAASTLSLKGLNSSPCPPISSNGCPYAGLLMWQDGIGSGKDNNPTSNNIIFGAGASLNVAGTIYAPTGSVSLHGSTKVNSGCSSGTSMNCASVQIIADTFTIDGGNTLDMPYDPSQLYHLDQKGLVR